MNIKLWYSKDIDQWRWILTSDEDSTIQESGGRKIISDALSDVATTIEYLLDPDQSP